MSLARRFLYYFIGIGLGVVFVYFVVLRGRHWPAWLPRDVIIEEILRNPIYIKAHDACAPEAFGLDSAQLAMVIKNASVDFKASKVHEKPCRIYLLKTNYGSKELNIEVAVCDSFANIDWVKPVGENLPCE